MNSFKLPLIQIVVFCLINTAAYAQIDTLKHFISGSIQFDIDHYQILNSNNNQNRNSWNLYSGINWSTYLKPHWSLSLGFGVESNYQKSEELGSSINTTVSKNNNYNLIARLRHIKPFAENWSLYTRLIIGGGYGINKIINNDETISDFNNHFFNSAIGLGINYKFHKHWSVEIMPLQLEYSYARKPSTATSQDLETDSRFSIYSFTNGFNLSFNYHY